MGVEIGEALIFVSVIIGVFLAAVLFIPPIMKIIPPIMKIINWYWDKWD